METALLTRVADIMSNYSDARDSDSVLIALYWSIYDTKQIVAADSKDGERRMKAITLESFSKGLITDPQTIGRARRRIQGTLGLLPPTSEKVAKQRRINAEQWREAMRNNFNKKQVQAIIEIVSRVKNANARQIKDIKNKILITV